MEIGIWGDSITYGAGDTEALGWVGRLRKAHQSDDEVSVYNRGICGDTSEDLLKRFDVEYESIQPTVVIFAIGINDSKYPVGQVENLVPLDKFEENIKTLIGKAKIHSSKIYIMGCTRVDETPRHSGTRFSNEQIQKYNDFLKNLSKLEQLEFIDVFEVISPATDLSDGLHPNAQGYEKLASIVINLLK
jgi:lysophospholipase L1-like esterase